MLGVGVYFISFIAMVVGPRQPLRANFPRFFVIFLLLTVSLKLVSSWSQYPGSPRRFSHPACFFPLSLQMASNDNDIVCPDDTQNAFRGKNVLLTGASGGLGHAFALQLAHCGVKTLVLSARSETSLHDVARECHEISSNTTTTTTTVHCIPCDLNKPDSVTQLGKESLKVCNDVIDILINNGGVSSRSCFLDTEPQVDRMVMQINFFAGASLAKAVVPGMVDRQSGAVLWISSVQGLFGLPERTSYAASKFAVQGYCEGLRAELASSGVQVHVASPGYIRTNLSRSAITGDGSAHGKLDSTTANGADPKEVAVDIMNAVANGKVDFVVAASLSAKVAPWIRFFAPSLWNNLLVKRYEKSKKAETASCKDTKQD